MPPIVAMGEVLWDIYPDGRKVLGGAPLNFAYHCQRLGHEAIIISAVGNDDLGYELLKQVRELGLTDEYIETVEAPTGTVQVTLDTQGVPSYEITQNVAWDEIGSPPEFGSLKPSALYYGTLAQRSVRSRLSILSAFMTWKCLKVYDINLRDGFCNSGVLLSSFDNADIVKCTEEELQELQCIFESIQPKPYPNGWPNRAFILWLTKGSAGAVWHAEYERFTQPATPVEVIDTVGAGDAFTAAMLVNHIADLSPAECLRLACDYAAKTCQHAGAIQT
jgi:fructokinase